MNINGWEATSGIVAPLWRITAYEVMTTKAMKTMCIQAYHETRHGSTLDSLKYFRLDKSKIQRIRRGPASPHDIAIGKHGEMRPNLHLR